MFRLRTRISIGPPASGRGPLDGVVEQVRDRAVEPCRRGSYQGRLGVEHEVAVGGVQSRPLDGRGGGEVEAHVLELELLDLVLGEVDEIGHEHSQLPQLRLGGGQNARPLLVGQALAERERVEVGLHARQRRPQLVRGVGDELALGQA